MVPHALVPLRAASLTVLFALAACSTPTPTPVPSAAPAAAPAAAASPVPRAIGGTDYRTDSHWLCRPGRDDACSQPLSAEPVVRGVVQSPRPDPAAPVDCFYIYPTISFDPAGNSDLVAGPEEKRVAQHQLAPFGTACRTFAPMYRQITLAALRSRFAGAPIPMDPAMAYADVQNAWHHYLDHDNKGRGVVLIGHSQGARMLAELISREIDGKPVQKQVISAVLLGANIAVPKGKDVGGAFKTVPLCRSVAQTGCLVAYTSFRSDSPPPADTLFGRVGVGTVGGTDADALTVACTNPAALAGGKGALDAWLPVRENLLGQASKAGSQSPKPFEARQLPNAECVDAGGVSYLSVNLPADVPGDLISNGQVLKNWGLHLLDANVATGNLLEIVRAQSGSYLRSNPGR